MKKRNAVIIVLASLFVVVMSIGITLAYLSDTEYVDNPISIKEGIVSIIESFPTVSEQHMENSFTKEVKVKNTGAVPCFVRVYADFSDSRIRENSKTKIVAENDNEYTWSDFCSTYCNGSNSDWEYVAEGASGYDAKMQGYFYYKKVVPVNGETPLLIKGVKVDYRANDTDSNIDKIQDFEMIVYTETVQTTEIDANGTVYGVSEISINGNSVDVNDQWKYAWASFLKVNYPTT